MKTILLSALALVLLVISAPAQGPVLFKRDSGIPKGHDTTVIDGWEETVIFNPGGPCALKQIYIYYDGTHAADDTLWIVGDPSEGALPPTSFVWSYNSLTDPIVVHYRGTPGWDTIDVSERGLRYDGYDRIAIQHRVHDDGPWFAVDNNGVASTLSSFLYDPYDYPDGFPVIGKYFAARGDLMVRLLLQFDFPSGNGSAKPPAATLVECAKAVGIVDTAGKPLKSARVSVADWNGDGWDDIAVGASFFQNNGDGTFKNISSTIGIQAGASVWGDYDNDGKIDCYAINGGAGDRLYHNNGNSTFTDVTAASGLSNPYPTVTPIWFDFDHDGKPDLFISNGRTEDASGEAYFPDQIWRGNGDGIFVNVTDSTGISPQEIAASPDGAQYSDCWGASVADYNQDGWPDIHVATYRLAADLLFKNNQNGTFTDLGEQTGVRGVPTDNPVYFGHGLGTEWGDYDNDGDLDLMVGNLGHPDSRGISSNPSLLFRNNGAPSYDFAEVHKRAGIKFFEMNAGV
ncbi:MAG: VCBS repeat-containing protein, partial [Candidatus Kapaibacterium sp.]